MQPPALSAPTIDAAPLQLLLQLLNLREHRRYRHAGRVGYYAAASAGCCAVRFVGVGGCGWGARVRLCACGRAHEGGRGYGEALSGCGLFLILGTRNRLEGIILSGGANRIYLHVCVGRHTNTHIELSIYLYLSIRLAMIDRQMDGYMDRWIDGYMDRWIDG